MAEAWSCSNEQAEIRCDRKGCDVETESFTPTGLTLDTDGNVSLGAYSGSWEGKAASAQKIGRYFLAVGIDLPWTGLSGDPTSLAAVVDTEADIAVVISSNFAQPYTCKDFVPPSD
jgi:hypothetical protein